MKQWEYLYMVTIGESVIQVNTQYMKIPTDFVQTIGDLGTEGWELVGLTTDSSKDDHNSYLKLVFKRPLE